jgi:hypothetical protein
MSEDSFKNNEIKPAINTEFKDAKYVEKNIRQLEAAREARAVVEQTFTTIASAQGHRALARGIRKKPDDGGFSKEFIESAAQEFETKAKSEICADKNVSIYDPNNPDRIKK